MISLGCWDAALLLLVSAQATVIARLGQPERKALVMALPIPSSLAMLAVGVPVSTPHVAGLCLLLAFMHGVRGLHDRARVPIIPAIVLSAVGYCVAGALLKPVLPQTPAAFWLACAATVLLALLARALFPHREEASYRSPLSLWVKIPIVVGVVALLILLKNILHGFTTWFPMVGVLAAYEARSSLGTMCRVLPDFMLAMVPMVAVIYLAQFCLGLPGAVGVGWLVFLPLLFFLTRSFRKMPPPEKPSSSVP
jgi:hypothetical protein